MIYFFIVKNHFGYLFLSTNRHGSGYARNTMRCGNTTTILKEVHTDDKFVNG